MAVSTTADGGRLAELSVSSLEMTGCKEATIGTRVDLRGDFVVNQFLRFDNPPPPEELSAIRNALVKDTRKKAWWEKLPVRSLALSLLVATIMSGGIVATTLLVKSGTGDSTDDVLADLDTLPMNFTYRLRSRSDWDAREPEAYGIEELYERPAGYVVVAHTATGSCDLPVFCENLILSIQQDHINQKLGDIGYNFLIGGDGCIYEGRGWGLYGAHTYGVNCASIGVAFIGNFDVMKLKRKMKNAFDLLIEEGVMLGELKPNYTLLAQSQVLITDSPGLNIKEQIKRWKNYGKIKRKVCL